MPQLSQWMIRTAFIYLLLGFTFGGLLLTHKGLSLHPFLWAWLPAHIEFLLFGWVVQLTMGVGFWILPRYRKKSRRPKETYARIAFILLNVGIWLIVAGTTFRVGHWAFLTGRIVEFGAIILFALQAWNRIVSREGP